MSAYFILTLDTAGPYVEIDTPAFIDPEEEVIITVNSDEAIKAAYIHELYIIDNQGTRYDLNYTLNSYSIVSALSLNSLGVSPGSATIYAVLYDEVLNPSNEAYKHFSTELPLIKNIIILQAGIENHIFLIAGLKK